MKHVAIVAWTTDNRVAKFMDFQTAKEAGQHIEKVKAKWPDAFVALAPKGEPKDWLVDPAAKSLAHKPISSALEPSADDIYDSAIQKQQLLRGLILALNDGTFIPGAGLKSAQLKQVIRSKM